MCYPVLTFFFFKSPLVQSPRPCVFIHNRPLGQLWPRENWRQKLSILYPESYMHQSYFLLLLALFFRFCISFLLHVYLVTGDFEEGIGSPGTGVTHGCEPPCGCWVLDLGSFQEQPLLSHLSGPPFDSYTTLFSRICKTSLWKILKQDWQLLQGLNSSCKTILSNEPFISVVLVVPWVF